jgi:hypothetical protein
MVRLLEPIENVACLLRLILGATYQGPPTNRHCLKSLSGAEHVRTWHITSFPDQWGSGSKRSSRAKDARERFAGQVDAPPGKVTLGQTYSAA